MIKHTVMLGVLACGWVLNAAPTEAQAPPPYFKIVNRVNAPAQVDCSVDDTTYTPVAAGSTDNFICNGTMTVRIEAEGGTAQFSYSFECETGQMHTTTARVDTQSGHIVSQHQCDALPAYAG